MADPFLEIADRSAVIQAIAGLADFRRTDDRVSFLDSSGLGRFLPGIDWEGSSRSVARKLVTRLERYGHLPERSTYHALGALLEAILGLGDLPPEEAGELASVIVRYSLIADPDHLDRLRTEHDVDAPAVREIPPEDRAPRARADDAEEGPRFEPQIPDTLAFGDKRGTEALETVLNTVDNFLDVQSLLGAVYSGQAVCRIEYPLGKARGTGFLLGPDLLLTNQHVIKSAEHLPETVARFDYVKDSSGVGSKGRVFHFVPDFYHSSPAEELDWALVRLDGEPLAEIAAEDDERSLDPIALARLGKHRGYLLPAPKGAIFDDLRRVNILQHPSGQPLKVVLTQNYVVRSTEDRLHYVADTMRGSSGSPVFNERWQVIALHHSGSPYPEPEGPAEDEWKTKYRVNEGIPMRAILEDLTARRLDRLLPSPPI